MRFHLSEIPKKILSFKNTHYTNIKLHISEGQKDKIKKAYETDGKYITIRFKCSDLYGEDIVVLTNHKLTD